MVPFRMPNFVGLLPSAEVAVNKPPPVDFLTPFVMEAIKGVKASTAEYRSAKSYQAESRNLSEYYRSRGMGDLANLIEKQSADLGPDVGSALMGINTDEARKRTMAGINAISAQEFKLRVDSADSKAKFDNALLLQQNAQKFNADQARLNDASNLSLAVYNKRVTELANEERDLQNEHETVAKLGLDPAQSAAAFADIQRRQAELVKKQEQLSVDREAEINSLRTPSQVNANPVTNPNILGSAPADDSGFGGSQTDLPSKGDSTLVDGSFLPGVGKNPPLPKNDPNQPIEEEAEEQYLPADGLVPPRARIVPEDPASNATTRTVSPNLTETPSVTPSKIPVTIARPKDQPNITEAPKANPDATLPTTPTPAPKAAPDLTKLSPTDQAIIQAQSGNLKATFAVFDSQANLVMREVSDKDRQNAMETIDKARTMLTRNPEQAMKILATLDAHTKEGSESGRTITAITAADIPSLKGTGIDLGAEVKNGVVILKVKGGAETQYKTIDIAINEHDRDIGDVIAKYMIGGNPTAQQLTDFKRDNPQYKDLHITYNQVVEVLKSKSQQAQSSVSPEARGILQKRVDALRGGSGGILDYMRENQYTPKQ